MPPWVGTCPWAPRHGCYPVQRLYRLTGGATSPPGIAATGPAGSPQSSAGGQRESEPLPLDRFLLLLHRSVIWDSDEFITGSLGAAAKNNVRMREMLKPINPIKPIQPPTESSLSLRTRFHVGIAFLLLIVCFISAFLIYRHEKRLLEEIAHANTELVMAAVEASRAYVREELRPRMFAEFGSDFFMMEAMSTSYVGRAVMDRFGRQMKDFQYRRVSINARNPNAEANEFERQMMAFFNDNPHQDNWQGLAGTRSDAHFMRYQPVFFETSCMSCHGVPENAPTDLLRQYGAQNGFGHYPGELAGLIAVGVPVHSALADIKERATSVFLTVFLGVSIFYLVSDFLFQPHRGQRPAKCAQRFPGSGG
jgi:hypothetical protein